MSSVFLSYSSADSAAADHLRTLLVEARYGAVFRDKHPEAGIPGGTKWAHELFLNLGRSDIVVFLATPKSLESKWCHTELAVAVAQGKHVVQISTEKVPVHPVLADRQAIGPIADLESLVGQLVAALTRVGFAPGDPFTWDADASPFPGLHRLTERHAAVLFGRDREIAVVLERLARPEPPAVLVVGPSGSGKSSLVRAGVMPRLGLQEGTTVLTVVEPGADPLNRVALAFERADPAIKAADVVADERGLNIAVDRLVAAGDGRVVLVLDQAEDLLTHGTVPAAGELARRLATVDRDRLAVIVILRSASLDAWLRDPSLAALTPADPVWVRPLDRSGLREIIERPARIAGIRFDPPELVDRILDNAGGGDALPLVAAMLEELTKGHSRLQPAVVTTELYDRVGEVAKVVDRRARLACDDIRAEYRAPESDAVDAYLRLVAIDDDGQAVRSEVEVADLPSDVQGMFGVFERHRLVVRDRRPIPAAAADATSPGEAIGDASATEIVRPIHEVVFRAWQALSDAIDDRRSDLQTRTWLRRDALTWATTGRGQVPLTGGRLALALDWSERNEDDVDEDMRAYLRAAVSERRRRRALTLAAPALAIVVLVVGGFAFQAIQARAQTEALKLAGDARANFETRFDLGLLLALEASAKRDDLQVEAMTLVGLTRGPGPRRFSQLADTADAAALDREGARSIIDAGDTELWDVAAGRSVGTVAGEADTVAISGDGSTVAIARPAGLEIRPWPGNSVRITCPLVGGGAVEHVRLAEDGALAIVVAVDRSLPQPSRVEVVSIADCSSVPLIGVEGLVVAVDVDSGADRVALGTEGGGANVWELTSGRPFFDALPSESDRISAVAFGGDDALAGVTPDGTLVLWNVRTGDANGQIQVYDTAAVAVRHWPEADGWVTANLDGELRVVTPSAPLPVGPPVRSLPDATYRGSLRPLDLATTADGAVTVDPAGRVVAWDLVGRPPLGDTSLDGQKLNFVESFRDGAVLSAGPGTVRVTEAGTGRLVVDAEINSPSAVAIDGDVFVVGTRDGEVWAGSKAGGDLRTIETGPAGVAAVALLPDGSIAVARATTQDGSIAVITGSGGRRERGLSTVPRSLATDGRWLFLGGMDGRLRVLDPTDPSRDVAAVDAHSVDLSSIAVAPDGSTIATGSDDRQIILWSVDDSGRPTRTRTLLGHGDRVTSLAFTPDGRWLASSGEDHFVVLWDVASGVQIGDAIGVPGNPAVAFAGAADRTLLLADDGLARWDVSPDSWTRIACDILGGRRLTDAERATFLGGAQPAYRCGTD